MKPTLWNLVRHTKEGSEIIASKYNKITISKLFEEYDSVAEKGAWYTINKDKK